MAPRFPGFPGYHWREAPQAVRRQVADLLAGLRAVLDGDLVGLYLHGSLAMGCYNPQRSDLDLIAVSRRDLTPEATEALTRLFLTLSRRPPPLEFHLLHMADLAAWRFPPPFRFHYSEGWRRRYEEGTALAMMDDVDPELAAHLTILHHRGIALDGPPIGEIFPAVRPADDLASILADGRAAAERLPENPVYGVLTLCRVLAYAAEGLIASKEEGGAWALARLPAEDRAVVVQALAIYRGEAGPPPLIRRRSAGSGAGCWSGSTGPAAKRPSCNRRAGPPSGTGGALGARTG